MERLSYDEKPQVCLVITHSGQATRRVVRSLGRPMDHRDVFAATEADVLAADTDDIAWQQCGNGLGDNPPVRVAPDLSLSTVVAWTDRLLELYPNTPGGRPVPNPDALYASDVRSTMPEPSAHLASALSVQLTRAEKDVLDLLAAWPLCTRRQLAGLMGGVTHRRVNQALRPLTRHRLVRSHSPRLVLTDEGQAHLARRDRAAVGPVLDRWSPMRVRLPDRRTPVYAGTALRTVSSQLRHQSGIADVAAALTSEVANSPDHDLIDLLPTLRSPIAYHYDGSDYVILPDASFTLVHRGRCHPYLLEFERRATTPRRVPLRLRSYRRYFRSGWPRRDHGGMLPTVLFVFESPAVEDAFLRAAARVEEVPFLTSNAETLAATGVLGCSWRSPLPRTPDRGDSDALDRVQSLRSRPFPALPSTHSRSPLRCTLTTLSDR